MDEMDNNLEHLRSAYRAFNRRDVEAFLDHLHPDIRWITPDLRLVPRVYRGRDGVREHLSELLTGDVVFTSEPQRFEALGDQVMAEVFHCGTNLVSGAQTTYRTVHLWTLPAGLATRYRLYLDAARAARALRGSSPSRAAEGVFAVSPQSSPALKGIHSRTGSDS